ncbi:MAG TPA: class I SAM-dependent methyltransferase [Polyangiaceae bacterium]
MSVFGAYSRYYNLLYRDKNYAAEAEYIRGLIERHRPGPLSVLDLGCGTGRHAFHLAEMGYDVTGVDRSKEMLDVARASAVTGSGSPRFAQGDVRSVRLGGEFDVVVSLFHVLCYMTSNDDLRQAFTTIREHLKPGGLFLFDAWYGPAVLSDRPAVRIKRLEDESIAVTRLAEPVMHANENRVDVNYHVFVKEKASGQVSELRETHNLRYFFAPELALVAEACGLRIREVRTFMEDRSPGFDTWNVIFAGTRESQ